ncbi:hypothetical protein BDV06DRAFT_229014 [Aspergillus oleicola]
MPISATGTTGGQLLFRPYEREVLTGKHFVEGNNFFIKKIHFCDFTETEDDWFKQLFNDTKPGSNVYFLMRWFWSCAEVSVLPYACVLVLHQHAACYSQREAFDNNRKWMPVDEEFLAKWTSHLADTTAMFRLDSLFQEPKIFFIQDLDA